MLSSLWKPRSFFSQCRHHILWSVVGQYWTRPLVTAYTFRSMGRSIICDFGLPWNLSWAAGRSKEFHRTSSYSASGFPSFHLCIAERDMGNQLTSSLQKATHNSGHIDWSSKSCSRYHSRRNLWIRPHLDAVGDTIMMYKSWNYCETHSHHLRRSTSESQLVKCNKTMLPPIWND